MTIFLGGITVVTPVEARFLEVGRFQPLISVSVAPARERRPASNTLSAGTEVRRWIALGEFGATEGRMAKGALVQRLGPAALSPAAILEARTGSAPGLLL